jgi:DNA mismatch repair ATPase MutS
MLIVNNPLVADALIEDYSTGKLRVANIMTHEETGIAAYNKQNVHYAETENLAKDLNVEKIAEFFGCKTVIGQSFLTETLKFPVTSEDHGSILTNRQNIIKLLVENPQLKSEIDALLVQAQYDEQEVIKLMSEFFMGQTCPELVQLETIKKQNPRMYPFFNFLVTNPTARTLSTGFNLFGMATSLGFAAFFGNIAYQCSKLGFDYTEPALSFTNFTILLGVGIYTNYQDYSMSSKKRVKMHSLNQLINSAEKIERLCSEHGVKNQFNISEVKDAEGVELIEGLKAKRYKDKGTMAFLTPLVHTFLYKMYQQEKHLAKIFACVAEMDAYNAIATKIIESHNEKNKLCFVTFLENEKPTIAAQSFWNVLVPNAVSNSISENRQVILTGPNAGGKTTTIRALLQNIVLGQSFGVAAAEHFEFTTFDVIHSYLNISDDLLNGLSLFASEIKRAQDVLKKIKALEPHKKFFFALDELFTGTVAEDGETCAYNFIEKIAAFNNIQFIYATHFAKLKELGNNTDTCVNYKVDAPTKNSDGKLVYPYTLSQGASDARVALDLAKEADLFA